MTTPDSDNDARDDEHPLTDEAIDRIAAAWARQITEQIARPPCPRRRRRR